MKVLVLGIFTFLLFIDTTFAQSSRQLKGPNVRNGVATIHLTSSELDALVKYSGTQLYFGKTLLYGDTLRKKYENLLDMLWWASFVSDVPNSLEISGRIIMRLIFLMAKECSDRSTTASWYSENEFEICFFDYSVMCGIPPSYEEGMACKDKDADACIAWLSNGVPTWIEKTINNVVIDIPKDLSGAEVTVTFEPYGCECEEKTTASCLPLDPGSVQSIVGAPVF
ncbi:hypothetical protein OAO01_03935 [Oligoflexia bacterium]|nr:hypothetical protein [Oligoflexia bacterium]